ncbi:hypothetical protein VE25_11705 [Devosia geojensis]|uniref:Right handed beta helix domain-containing protein n=1 Tax=Devosia geojensis TaxID=443610 RepID=A0A0F5FS16_9HYPH|nr:TIGR03808 family TAT-translocated repetitive protein [Devosia geojensis]KKB11646.1 hypothetical protein VE25_11705 [Devosia geojensis]
MQQLVARADRRLFLKRLGATLVVAPAFAPLGAHAAPLEAETFALVADAGANQSRALQAAVDTAAGEGRPLLLPAGTLHARDLTLPDGLTLQGVRGRSRLAAWQDGPVAQISGARAVTVNDVDFAGATDEDRGLIEVEGSAGIGLYRCAFLDGAGTGLLARDSQVVVDDCTFSGLGDAAIHSMDGRGLAVTGCRIRDCGNAGIRIWRSTIGEDPTIIANNDIRNIDWQGGGNGQNGNGINIFRASGVIVSANRMFDCAFSAVRLNAARNTQVSDNICLTSGEVAIFSEFEFSGSVIANNIVDGAAGGISITNLDRGGQLAVCSGNIVRNIAPFSSVNPDVSPYGIYAEAETVITGNTVENVPGRAIAAGYGPFLRNVVISGNMVRKADIGIAVSVVDGTGAVHIANNLLAEILDHKVAGLAWDDVVEPDLLANAGRFANVSVSG